MSTIDLKDLGITQEDLIQRIVDSLKEITDDG